jgi:hypothetical protein
MGNALDDSEETDEEEVEGQSDLAHSRRVRCRAALRLRRPRFCVSVCAVGNIVWHVWHVIFACVYVCVYI